MISIKLVYMDGIDLMVNLKNEHFSQFFECLNKNKVFWEDDAKKGFWTNLSDVRFIQFFMEEEKNESKENGINESKDSGVGEEPRGAHGCSLEYASQCC